MQLTLGRRWAVTLEINVRFARIRDACVGQVRDSSVDPRRYDAAQLKWERDKLAATMLSGWFDAPQVEDYRSAGRRVP